MSVDDVVTVELPLRARPEPPEQQAIFTPNGDQIAASQLTEFISYVESETSTSFPSYQDFQTWAAAQYRDFWRHFVHWSGAIRDGCEEPVCTSDDVQSAQFFPRLRLSYAENLLAGGDDDPALIGASTDGPPVRLTRGELRTAVVRTVAALRELGLREGDRVASVVRNTTDAVVVALAAAALGATFSSAAADMGPFSTLARFRQLHPTLLVAHLRQPATGASFEMAERIAEIAAGLPTLRAVIALDRPDGAPVDLPIPVHVLADLQAGRTEEGADFSWPRFAFNHPLFVLFSSGTTGQPKCIVHGAGGTLLEHLKEHRLHGDLRHGDRLFFQTSAAWMMWNWQLSGLACGAEILLYDGPVVGPQTLWQLVGEHAVTVFGTSPPYLRMCQDLDWSPVENVPLDALRAVLSTGSILADRQYDWVRDHVGHVPLQSISGGTDILGCFVLGNPNLPVHRGEAQCRSLGMDIVAEGATAVSPIGELVCRKPFPSRPLGLFGDDDGTRFNAAYFAQQPGVWTHGDLLELTASGGARIHGRSDSVLNINGVRIGPAEIYQILDDIPQIRAAVAVEQPTPDGGRSRLVLLVQTMRPGQLTPDLERRIRGELAQRGSPAHVPALLAEVPDLPVTFSGKRSEAAVRHLLAGSESGTTEALANPECLRVIAWQVALEDGRRASAAQDQPSPPAKAPSGGDEDGTLRTMCLLMARTLGLAEMTPDDNFFDLGGDSLRAVELLAMIADQLHREVVPSVLLSAPTPRQFAATIVAAIGSGGPVSTAPLLMRPGAGSPVFLLPGAGGDVFILRTVCGLLRTGRPVYGLRASGLDPRQPVHRTVQEIAEYFLGQMREIQPAGPYSLIGLSFGGLVGYEIAARLRAVGERVDPLVLIDTHVIPLDRWRHGLWWLAWRMTSVVDVIREPREQVPRVLLRLASRRVSWITVPATMQRSPAAIARVKAHGDRPAYLAYRPSPCPQEIVFMRAANRRALYGEPLRDWRRLTGGGVTVVPVPGDHVSMLREPHAGALAARLSEHLPRAEQLPAG